ncbi:two-component sensor histidine kinase [Altererythrobacter luteolus]|uniref:histidine kinase n=1 Tax=Pontixanthobacter luteolus TaxID=295089 RepID=A0A6I4V4B3_9SPHN|nr:ATP-binding protein [Pontixanthobacter luteolus]MXP47680.1 two-component sensor histidine kinase [Pontixanthobacter luteolus]
MRFWPKSLLGQVLLAVALALLVAQTISAGLLWRAAETRRDEALLNSAAFRLVVPERQNARRDLRGADNRPRNDLRNRTRRFPRPLRLETSASFELMSGETRETQLEEQLAGILADQNFSAAELIVIERLALDDPFVLGRPRLMRRVIDQDRPVTKVLVAALKRTPDSQWQIARVPIPESNGAALRTIVLQTLIIYLVLVGLHFLLLRRITKPLAALTRRTENFGNGGQMQEPLEPNGPQDVRRLVTAHNAMEARIAALLDEKDVMLGAIGHDLKTPLAALRVRIENVEDETERRKMAAGIEDITRSLDDILTLARIGKSGEPPERASLSALAAAVVEEFEDQGQPVTLNTNGKIVHPVYLTWLKRALRNLIGNALRYGGTAAVTLRETGTHVVLEVDDNGPGIEEARIAEMLEPFKRGEASRNRDTGGAGLGLTIARAVAEQHGGRLILANRPEGGLHAEIRLPKG